MVQLQVPPLAPTLSFIRTMALHNISFPKLNPFYFIKVRQIFLWLILMATGIAVQLFYIVPTLIGFKVDSKDPDPIFASLGSIITTILTIAWLLRQCRLLGINLEQLIGKVPSNYKWLPIVRLIIARVLFSKGIFRLSYYPLSFIAPSFVETILNYNINNSFLVAASKTFAPALYYLLEIIGIFVTNPVFYTFGFQGIVLHRWAAKWGIRPAIFALCILFGVLSYGNVIGVISIVLIDTLLYIKTRTLIVPIMAYILDAAISIFLNLLLTISNSTKTASVLEQFRSEWRLGVFFLVLSAPWVVHFIVKNWPSPNEQLPYFANNS